MLVPGRDYIGIGVGAMVAGPNSHFFLARRGLEARNEVGTWEFPGGAVRFGERLEDSVVREFREEYGICIEVFGLLGVFDHLLSADRQHWVSITYLARHATGTPIVREPTKCTEIGWFPLEALPSTISRITSDNIREYYADGARSTQFQQWLRGRAHKPG